MYHNTFSTIINCNIDQIYLAFKDIKNYPNIVPYIKEIFLYSSDSYPIKAHILLEHFLIKLNYYCDIYFDDKNYSIKIDGYEGSFEEINGFWELKKISENETKISYDLKFKLKSRIQQKIASRIFDLYERRIFDKLKYYIISRIK
jgi:ribosome-associated toxin RatA of RatAB toxin-antitoxin module